MIRRLAPASAAIALAAALATGCEAKDPCRTLADRDCERYGESSETCRDSRVRAGKADPFLVEVCRRVLERGETAWRRAAPQVTSDGQR